MSTSLGESAERDIASPDDALLPRLRAGDEAAFLELIDRCGTAMHRIARAYVRDDATADEVVQDAWIGVLRGLERFEGRSSVRGWVFAIVANTAKTRGAREARCVPFSALAADEVTRDDPSVEAECFAGPGSRWPGHWSEGLASWGERPEQRLLGSEMRAHIDAAIDTLPPAQRTVVLMRDVGRRSSADVGNVLQLSETNVRVLLHRARAKIRRALEPYLTDGVLLQ